MTAKEAMQKNTDGVISLNDALGGHDPETTHFVIGLFQTSEAMKEATSALDRHQFVDNDLVLAINQNEVSSEDVPNGQSKRLTSILNELGIPSQKTELYANKLKQGYTLLVVRTEIERVREASNIMRQANAEDIT